MNDAQIHAATTSELAYFKVSGRATFSCATDFRNCAKQLVKGAFRRFEIDLRACTGMDSTFMGVLAMMGLERLKRTSDRIKIVSAGKNNTKLLTELGLKRLFDFEDMEQPQLDWITVFPSEGPDKPTVITLEDGRLMLEAHQTLMDVHEDNVTKFQGVVDTMKNDVEQMESDDNGNT